MKYLFLSLLLLCSTAYGQIQVEKEYQQYEPVEITCLLPESAQVLWEVAPLDGQKTFSLRDYSTVQAFWGEPGRYEVEATVIVVDFDKKTFDVKRHKSLFTILGTVRPVPPGPGPGPKPPEPSPDFPTDEFDNLGARIDAEADKIGLQYDKRVAVASIYKTASQKMGEPGGFITVAEARDWIQKELSGMSLDSSWASVSTIIREDAAARAPLSWEETKNYYLAIAVGYNGGSL